MYPEEEIDRRRDEMYLVYHGRDWESIEAVLRRHQVQYVVYRPLLQYGEPIVTLPDGTQVVQREANHELYRTHAELVYEKNGIEIFRLNF
jgi:hypothetical protein